MRIVQLTAENIKRLKAVQITPEGDLVVVSGKNGAGKQQPVSEPVLTPQGWKPIGAIQPGEFVIGSSGLPTQVLAVFPQAERRTFSVTLDDGSQTRCGPEHLWTVMQWATREGGMQRITETLTTAQLIERGLRRGSAKRWAVPIVGEIAFADCGMAMPIDPYVLGVILGDGHVEPTGYVTVTSWDAEILETLASHTSSFWRGEHEIGTGMWSRPLRHLGLAGRRSWEKFVPEPYLRASIEDRRSLLAGLLDTDGCASGAWAEMCSTSEALVDAVVTLGRSLGFVCKKGRPLTKKYRYLGELKEGRPAWVVRIKSLASPFTLERKTSAWRPSEQRSMPQHFIDSIEAVDDEDSVCIKVAAEDGLYVTKDFIVTHNSSVLDSITMALGGKATHCPEPVRKGAKRGEVVCDLGDLVVTRTFTAAGGGSLVVKTKDGAVKASPQTILDELVGRLTFDPLEFSRMKAKDQAETIRSVAGLDFSSLEQAKAEAYEKRTEVNREAKALKARLDASPGPHAVPETATSIDELMERLRDGRRVNEQNAEARRSLRSKADLCVRLDEERRSIVSQIRDLEQKLEEWKEKGRIVTEKLEAAQKDAEGALLAMAEIVDVDLSAVEGEIASLQETTAKIAANRERAELEKAYRGKERMSDLLTQTLADLEEERVQAIASAPLPVPGLGFTEEGDLTMNGVPFEQASQAEQLRVSIAVGMAANPKLRVMMIRDGSLLDSDSMAIVARMAAENDFQVWLERVEDDEHCSVVIEDGEVV